MGLKRSHISVLNLSEIFRTGKFIETGNRLVVPGVLLGEKGVTAWYMGTWSP